MDEPEVCIVTVECAGETDWLDMQIPAELPVSILKTKILDIMKAVYEGKYDKCAECRLMYEKRALSDEETLLSVGAFDGSRITVIMT